MFDKFKKGLKNLFGGGDEAAETPAAKQEEAPKAQTTTPAPQAQASDVIIAAPLEGELIELKDIPDPVFSSGALGKGIGIVPANGKVYSPINGTISTIFDTKHAVGLVTPSGEEILIHVGVDTVNMGGKGFTALAQDGQEVKVGDPLLEVDIDEIQKAGYSPVTAVLVTNTDEFKDVVGATPGQVKPGDKAITIKK